MIKAIKVEEKLVYYCGDCGRKLDRVRSGYLWVDEVRHVMLRCPVCFTLSSVGQSDCGNEGPLEVT